METENYSNFKPKHLKIIVNLMLIAFSVFFLFIININPITSKLQNILKIFFIIIIWIGIFNLLYKIKKIRLFWIILQVFIIIFFFFHSEKINSKELHSIYLSELISFKGVKYVWGGESNLGIDCSGLPRRSIRNAYLKYGITNLNGKAISLYLKNWWFDSSALALMNNYKKYVIDKKIFGTIKSISYKNLNSGDLAITKSGLHVMVYYGDNLWIQADPNFQSVIIQNARIDENPWFNEEISIFRWKELD